MKNIITTLGLIAILISCSALKESNHVKNNKNVITNDTIRIANDSLDYEIMIIEPGFYGWLGTQPQRGYYTQSSMEITNQFKVREYNLRVLNPTRFDPNLYVWRIDYESKIDYGYEVNWLLYNYFLFFEKKYNQKLM